MNIKYISLLLFLAAAVSVQAQLYGVPDPSFGINGIQIATIGNNNLVNNSVVAVQSDGFIVIAGTFSTSNYSNKYFLIRLDTVGGYDFGFGNSGVVIDTTSKIYDSINAIAIQDDGKIVLAGSAGAGFHRNLLLLRFNADGTPDGTFGTNGRVTKAIGSNDAEAWSVVMQADQNIVVGGFAYSGSKRDFLLARFTSTGAYDATFGSGGKVLSAVDTAQDAIMSIALQQDQMIVAGGISESGIGTLGYIGYGVVARYSSTGTQDNNFGTSGVAQWGMSGTRSKVTGVAVQSADQMIVVAGQVSTNSANGFWNFGIARLDVSGGSDHSFGLNGFSDVDFNNNDDYCLSMAIKPNGKIALGGYSWKNSSLDHDFAVAQFQSTGNLDVYFANQGRTRTDIGQFEDFGMSLAVQADNKILLAGTTDYSSNAIIGVVRYIGELVINTANNNIAAAVIPASVCPNPSTGMAQLKYQLPKATEVSLKLYDTDCRLVYEYMNHQQRSAGMQTENIITPLGCSSKAYLLVLETGSGNATLPVVMGK